MLPPSAKDRLKRLFSRQSIPPWVLILLNVVIFVWDRLDDLSLAREIWHGGYLQAAWALATSDNVRIALLVIGFIWLGVLVMRDPTRSDSQSAEEAEKGGIKFKGTGTVSDLDPHAECKTTLAELQKQVGQNCSDERLHRWAKDDRASAWRMVKFIGAACELHIAEDGPPPFIIFTFAVFSMTLREVSIRDEIAGAIEFKVPEHRAWRLRRSVEMEHNGAKQVLFRGNYHFKVRQDLTREDADYIRGNTETGFFKMDELVIRISGDGLDDPRLDTRFSVKVTEGYRPTVMDFLFLRCRVNLALECERPRSPSSDMMYGPFVEANKVKGATLFQHSSALSPQCRLRGSIRSLIKKS